MACFSCGEGKDLNTISLLNMYKEASQRTGIIYWFYKEVSSNEIKIMDNESFIRFKSANRKAFEKKKIEYSRIDEFRLT